MTEQEADLWEEIYKLRKQCKKRRNESAALKRVMSEFLACWCSSYHPECTAKVSAALGIPYKAPKNYD